MFRNPSIGGKPNYHIRKLKIDGCPTPPQSQLSSEIFNMPNLFPLPEIRKCNPAAIFAADSISAEHWFLQFKTSLSHSVYPLP